MVKNNQFDLFSSLRRCTKSILRVILLVQTTRRMKIAPLYQNSRISSQKHDSSFQSHVLLEQKFFAFKVLRSCQKKKEFQSILIKLLIAHIFRQVHQNNSALAAHCWRRPHFRLPSKFVLKFFRNLNFLIS